MPLNARQIDAAKSLLRRSAELVVDAIAIAEEAGDRAAVIRLNTRRRELANEIADIGRSGGQARAQR